MPWLPGDFRSQVIGNHDIEQNITVAAPEGLELMGWKIAKLVVHVDQKWYKNLLKLIDWCIITSFHPSF